MVWQDLSIPKDIKCRVKFNDKNFFWENWEAILYKFYAESQSWGRLRADPLQLLNTTFTFLIFCIVSLFKRTLHSPTHHIVPLHTMIRTLPPNLHSLFRQGCHMRHSIFHNIPTKSTSPSLRLLHDNRFIIALRKIKMDVSIKTETRIEVINSRRPDVSELCWRDILLNPDLLLEQSDSGVDGLGGTGSTISYWSSDYPDGTGLSATDSDITGSNAIDTIVRYPIPTSSEPVDSDTQTAELQHSNPELAPQINIPQNPVRKCEHGRLWNCEESYGTFSGSAVKDDILAFLSQSVAGRESMLSSSQNWALNYTKSLD